MTASNTDRRPPFSISCRLNSVTAIAVVSMDKALGEADKRFSEQYGVEETKRL